MPLVYQARETIERGYEKLIFLVRLTTSTISNDIRLIPGLLIVMTPPTNVIEFNIKMGYIQEVLFRLSLPRLPSRYCCSNWYWGGSWPKEKWYHLISTRSV